MIWTDSQIWNSLVYELVEAENARLPGSYRLPDQGASPVDSTCHQVWWRLDFGGPSYRTLTRSPRKAHFKEMSGVGTGVYRTSWVNQRHPTCSVSPWNALHILTSYVWAQFGVVGGKLQIPKQCTPKKVLFGDMAGVGSGLVQERMEQNQGKLEAPNL